MSHQNDNNIAFIASVFKVPIASVAINYPDYNYRLRAAGLTNFEPYISEAPRLPEESEKDYENRVLVSGRYFGQQDLILNDLVHSPINIDGLDISGNFPNGILPKTHLLIDKCIKHGSHYDTEESRDLNDSNYVVSHPPTVIFPVDLSAADKGYMVYRKTSSVNKSPGSNGSLLESVSGWYPVTGFSNNDIKDSLDGGVKIIGFTDAGSGSETNLSGYESYRNELFTSYKIIDSGVLESPPSFESELTRDRVVNLRVDPARSYGLERRVTRKSHDDASNPADWENISPEASFPYKDDEDLSDYINTNINFQVSGVYDTIETTGEYAEDGKDYFEVDFVEDWGRSSPEEMRKVTNREKTDELTFKSGESLKVIQRSTYKEYSEDKYDQYASIDVHFSPYGTGISGHISGSNNEKNFYQLEYQIVPKTSPNKKLYYEKVNSSSSLLVGESVFYNTGHSNGAYTPLEVNIFGKDLDIISPEYSSLSKGIYASEAERDSSYIGASQVIGESGILEPEIVPDYLGSGEGYSNFSSGEKYLVTPKGGYSTLHSTTPVEFDSAGEKRRTFFQGEQENSLDSHYALTEYRTRDTSYVRSYSYKSEDFIAGREREVRIGERALCLGDSATDLKDLWVTKPENYMLDPARRRYETATQYKNATILNIDSSDGSIKTSNLKNNKLEFQERSNLLFEKNYVTSLTILATGQEQNLDPLKEFVGDGKVYYLERDIYIDSDTNSQANNFAPIFRSDERDESMSPFSVDSSTKNPNAFGEEKHYLTQVFHKDTSFPYNDFNYYNFQPTIDEEFISSNSPESIIGDFAVDNVTEENFYHPRSFSCAITRAGDRTSRPQGYCILTNTGFDSEQAPPVTTGNIEGSTLAEMDMTFTPTRGGVYYELQARETPASDWQTLSPVIEAEAGGSGSIKTRVHHEELIKNANHADGFSARVLEWIPSTILQSYEGLTVPNESTDSLILKSAAGDRFYDISKSEHIIETKGTVETPGSAGNWAGTGDLYQIQFTGGTDDDYLSIESHRSFNIQPGEFSFEFWIKDFVYDASYSNIIFENEGLFKVYMSSGTNLKVDFKNENQISHDIGASTSEWKHIAICKVMARDGCRLLLYVDGEVRVIRTEKTYSPSYKETEYKYLERTYSDFKGHSNFPLVVGRGFTGELYQPRIYIGKSLYRDSTLDNSKIDFKEDESQRKYKILKLHYARQTDAKHSWIINRNQFENVGPPSDYMAAGQDPEATYHMYEWLNEKISVDDPATTATINYLNGYAYRAPNNPHINKNYEGEPITKAAHLDEVVADNYFYRVRNENRDAPYFEKNKAPYLYELLVEGPNFEDKIYKTRFSKKGGQDTKAIPKLSAALDGGESSFGNASRLRITKYVYRLYTKTAVVVGDLGQKGTRGSQSGWTHQLQYKAKEAGSWGDWIDSDSTDSYTDYALFYNDIDGLNINSFDNIDQVTFLPRIVIKSDITEKYKPEDVEFRIEKRQIISISDNSSAVDVIKKVNFLPIEVTIPTTGTFLDLTEKGLGDIDSDLPHDSQHFSVYDSANVVAVRLQSDQNYVLYKDPSESILLSNSASNPLEVQTTTWEPSLVAPRKAEETDEEYKERSILTPTSKSYYAPLEDRKPYTISNLTGIRISGAGISNLASVKSRVGVRPSGLVLNRLEKYKESFSVGESLDLAPEQTKYIFSPSITGSHFDQLEDFAKSSSEESLIEFTCSSFITGSSDGSSENISVETGVSGVVHAPVYQFENSPIMTGEFNITADDNNKTFLCSGPKSSGIFSGSSYSFDIINLNNSDVKLFASKDLSASAPSKTIPATGSKTIIINGYGGVAEDPDGTPDTGVLTILPKIVGSSATDTLAIVEDIEELSSAKSCIAVNIGSGICEIGGGVTLGPLSAIPFNSSSNRINSVDSGILVVDHDHITLTEDDANITGVIDTNSTLVLPSGLGNQEHVTFLNATLNEIKVISESGYKIDSKLVDYIPRESSKKFTCSKSESSGKTARSWSTSNVEVVKYNQISVDSGDDGEVFIHNEDVDVRLDTTGISGDTFSFNVLRSQVNDLDFSDLKSEKTPILRIFIDNSLKYTAPPGVVGVRVEKKGYGWAFEKIEIIYQTEMMIDQNFHGRVYSYLGHADELSFKFKKADYLKDFEFFLICGKSFSDLTLKLSSEDNTYRFSDQDGHDIEKFTELMSRKDLIKISKSTGNVGEESGGPDKFYIEMQGEDVLRKNNNKKKINQPDDKRERVIINRNEDFSIELPTLGSSFDYSRGFDLSIVNASETNCNVLLPAEVKGWTPVQVSFGASNYIYDKDGYGNEYENVTRTSVESFSSPELSNGDFLVLDGSLEEVALRSIFRDDAPDNKYDDPKGFFSSKISLVGASRFSLTNHGLVTNHKMSFLCDRLTSADYYYETSSWNPGTLPKETNTVLTNGGGNSYSMVEGETLLVHEVGAGSDNGIYFLYEDRGVDDTDTYRKLILIGFQVPDSLAGIFPDNEGTFEYSANGPVENGLMFVRIAKGSNKETVTKAVVAGNIYDLYSEKLSTADKKDATDSIPFSISAYASNDTSVDVSDIKVQNFFVKVFDDNEFYLYSDKELTSQITYSIASDYTFFSERFYTDTINYGKVSIINLGGEEQIKSFSDNSTVTGGVGPSESVELFHSSDNFYSSGDLTASGVYLMTGWNGSTDTLDVDESQTRQIVTSGKFHAKGSLTSDGGFDNSYYINAGLDEVEITNIDPDPDEVAQKIEKNRAYKHVSDGNFTQQNHLEDPASSNRDVIYYPKNEIHIPDRASLGIHQKKSPFEYNFVFYETPLDEDWELTNNEDLVIVLPNTFSRLGKVAVVNKHNRPINVASFSGEPSVSVPANSILFIDSPTDYSGTPVSLYNTEKYNYSYGDHLSVVHSEKTYKIYQEEEGSYVVRMGTKTESFFISVEGDIILDSDTHHGKKILVEHSPRFLRPYVHKPDGATYVVGSVFEPISAEVYFSFEIVNISTKRVAIRGADIDEANTRVAGDFDGYRDGYLYPLVNYTAEVNNFTVLGDYPSTFWFRHISPVIDQQPDDISHAETSLDSSKKYQVFGKELPVSLNVYYDKITRSDAEQINFGIFNGDYSILGDEDSELRIDLTENDKYYKITGIGGDNVSNLNIVNTLYENIKIKNVTAVDGGSNDLTPAQKQALGQKILSYFPTEHLDQSYYLLELDENGDNGIGEAFSRPVGGLPSNYLEKGQVLSIGLPDIITDSYGLAVPASFILDNNEVRSMVEEDEPFYINFNKNSKVRFLKRETSSVNLSFTEDDTFRHVFTGPQDVYLPSRKDLDETLEDTLESAAIYFTIINASRNGSTLRCPEGISVFGDLSISADAARKIKYSGGTFTDVTSDGIEGVAVESLAYALFNCPSGRFVSSKINSSLTPLAIDAEVGSIKIINNTGSSFYITNSGAGLKIANEATYTMPKDTYSDFIVDGSGNFNINNDNKNRPLHVLRDGAVELSSTQYENRVVFFDAATVKLFNFINDAYFATTFVPLIRVEELNNNEGFTRGDATKARTKTFSSKYTLFNQYADKVEIAHINPIKFNENSDKKHEIKAVRCQMYEFILDESVKDKIVLGTKEYDYIFKNSAATEFCLYNGDGSDINLRRLDSDNNKFNDEETLLPGSVVGLDNDTVSKVMISCVQSGANDPVVSELQSYTEVFRTGFSFMYSAFLYKNFYLNKPFYNDKVIIFKDSFDIIYPSEKDNTIIGNMSDNNCYTFLNKTDVGSDEGLGNGTLPVNRSMRAAAGETEDEPYNVVEILKPKHSINSTEKVLVATEPADIEFTGASVGGLTIINISSRVVDVTAGEETNKLYSSERANYASATDVSHGLCPRFNRRDWFVRLKGVDIPHLERDEDYYNEKEEQAEWLSQPKKPGQIMVKYLGPRYKLSNIFTTNRETWVGPRGSTVNIDPKGLRSGYEGIAFFNDFYKFGVTMYGDKKDQTKKVFFDANPASYVLSGLKLPWNMPSRVLAYALSTGHERLCFCKEFNERTGRVTLSGVVKDRYYVLDGFDKTYYDYVHDATMSVDKDKSRYKYGETYKYYGVASKEFQPVVVYNGKEYKPGEKFKGVEGVKNYEVDYNYFATVRGSLFASEGLDELADDIDTSVTSEMDSFNKEIESKKDTAESGVVSPTWSKVVDSSHKRDFLNGKIEKIVPYNESYELINGRKLKDIEGTFTEDYFEFKIAKDAALAYTEYFTDVEHKNKEEDNASDYYLLRVGFSKNNIDSPGYEYEIQSTLSFTNNITVSGQQKDLLTISFSARDSLPFLAHGTISSLNLDFKTDAKQEFKIREAANQGVADISRIVSMSEKDRLLNLNNHQGYSFVPFGINPNTDYLYGLSYKIGRDKNTHSGIRFRLKKLSQRKLIFENLKEDRKIGSYLKTESETAGLRYNLDTEVNSISYHDIARPGGVLTMSDPGWKDVVLSSGQLKIIGPASNGDAIVFKNSNGSIVGGTPYFVRVVSRVVSANEEANIATLLKIYTSDSSLDSINKIDADIQTANKYKIVNYFTLGTDSEGDNNGTHRSVKSVLPIIYNTPDNVGKPVTSLNFPVVIGSRTFLLEPPKTFISGTQVDSWAGFNVHNGYGKIRANLELSTISTHWTGETSKGASFEQVAGLGKEYVEGVDSHWVDKDIFSSYKNLLYRSNAQIQRVNYSKTDKTITVNIKLNTRVTYRYIYKKNDAIVSVTLNGSLLSGDSCDIFRNEKEDVKVVLSADSEDYGNDLVAREGVGGIPSSIVLGLLYKNICIVESAEHIDDNPIEDEDDDDSSYFDYEIPSLNDGTSGSFDYSRFTQVYPSYYTAEFNGLLSRNQKEENLVIDPASVKPIAGKNNFKAGLFYDMGMPALCKYIYPVANIKNNSLDFTILDYWDGFTNGFGSEEETYKTKPISFSFDLESSSDGLTWSSVEKGFKHYAKNGFSHRIEGLEAAKIYRMVITNVTISHKSVNESAKGGLWTTAEKNISKLRVPFKWTSTIFDSDLIGDGTLDGGSGLYYHSLDMVENPVIKKSVSFPEDGLTKLGRFDFIKKHYHFGIEVPYTRLYLLDLSHNMRATYKDPINRGGISKVIITDRGNNYRTPPTIEIEKPESYLVLSEENKKNSSFQEAEARAIIEDGRLKHIDVVNSGYGYADLDKKLGTELRKGRVEQFRSDATPYLIHTLTIGQVSSPNKEKFLGYIGIEDQPLLKLYKVDIKGNESSLPDEPMEEFGLTFADTEKIADYIEYDSLSKSSNYPSVNFMKGSAEDDDTWSDVQNQADRIRGIRAFSASALEELEGSRNFSSLMEDEISEVKGTENKYIDGLYEEDGSDLSSVSNRSMQIKQSDDHLNFNEYVTYPLVESGVAWAVVNDSSIADYRVIDNEIASKTTPWISSFSRDQNPGLPKSFGIVPSSDITAEVFNTYARAVNHMHKIRIESPIYAKVRRFKQTEYRYISNPDMAGLTFEDADDAGDVEYADRGHSNEQDYYTYENKSRVNYITYKDPSTDKTMSAHFSAFQAENGGKGKTKGGGAVDKENIVEYNEHWGMSPLWDWYEKKLSTTTLEHGSEIVGTDNFKEQTGTDDPSRKPISVGFPSVVNIPEELGVYCNPSMKDFGKEAVNLKGIGIPLPKPLSPRAYAYGGELIYTSDIYDVSDDSLYGVILGGQFEAVEGNSLVNIRGSDYITAGYQNEIIFGCQAKGKPFFSAFLKTVKVWTEYEVVSSPEFTETLPEGLKEKYKPEESQLRCLLIERRTVCNEAKIGTVGEGVGRHSLCEDGGQNSTNVEHSYERVFGLNQGDSVIGPESTETESESYVQVKAKGTFKVEPEFDLAMAVYGSNKYIDSIKMGVKGGKIGPCIHHCIPGQIKVLRVSDDPLIFDLKK